MSAYEVRAFFSVTCLTSSSSSAAKVAGKVYRFHTESLLSLAEGDLDTSAAAKVYTVDAPLSEFGKTLDTCANGSFFSGAPCTADNDGMVYVYAADGADCTEIGNN